MYNMTQVIQQRNNTIAKPQVHVLMKQMSIWEGISKFGDKGNHALLKELSRLHEWQVYCQEKK